MQAQRFHKGIGIRQRGRFVIDDDQHIVRRQGQAHRGAVSSSGKVQDRAVIGERERGNTGCQLCQAGARGGGMELIFEVFG